MRGMRPAKNPKARSAFKPRQIRSRRDAEEIEFEDEDYEALEDCDGTEEGQVAELCKQPRVSALTVFLHTNSDINLEHPSKIFSSPFLSKKENSSDTPPPLSSGAEDTFPNVTVKEFMNTVSTVVLKCTKVLRTANKLDESSFMSHIE